MLLMTTTIALFATKNNIESSETAKGFLYSLEDSTIGITISSTQWGYPIVLSLHAIGMAIMVGVSLMLCARFIGFTSTIPLSSFAPYCSIGLIGFVINFLSGTFFSISVLPDEVKYILLYNPYYYLITFFRNSFFMQVKVDYFLNLIIFIFLFLSFCITSYVFYRGYRVIK